MASGTCFNATFMGVIGSYVQMGGDTTFGEYCISYQLRCTCSMPFMTEGQEQARLATVLCAPVVVWFVISAVMGLEIMGVPVAEFPSGLLPITLWTLPMVTGILNWNSN